MYTVGQVSRLSGVTVRTLHHYDEIGLLAPSGRSSGGYRQYGERDLERLQEILFYRELGFGLDEIGGLVDSTALDRRRVLEHQRRLIERHIENLQAMVAAVDAALAAQEEGRVMDKEEMFEVFGGFDATAYQDEVQERWGDTEAYAESARRTNRYTRDDWKRQLDESNEIAQRLADLYTGGSGFDGPEAMQAAEDHRLHIDRWFYPCSFEAHAGLGEMYVADPRFTKYWDGFAKGLAPFVRDAFRANAARQESG